MNWVVIVSIWVNSIAIVGITYHLKWTNDRITELRKKIWLLELAEARRPRNPLDLPPLSMTDDEWQAWRKNLGMEGGTDTDN